MRRPVLAGLALLAAVACHHSPTKKSVDAAPPTADAPRSSDAAGSLDASACWPDPTPCGSSCSSSQYCYQVYAGVAPAMGCNAAPASCGTTVNCACVVAALQAESACAGYLTCTDCTGTVMAICSLP